MPQSSYVSAGYRNDPLGFLIKLMDLQRFSLQLRHHPDSLPILTGIVTYRGLSRQDAMAVTEKVHSRLTATDAALQEKRLMSHLYGIISMLPANPYWFAWSLSDAELRDYYERNKGFSDAIEFLGLNFGNFVTVSTLAGGMLSLAENGVAKAVREAVRHRTSGASAAAGARLLRLPAYAVRSTGIGGAMVAVFAGVMHAMTSRSEAQARRELALRGLATQEDLAP